MKRTQVSRGVYRTPNGEFWLRLTHRGRRTWKRMASITVQDALDEAAAIRSDSKRSELGLCRDPLSPHAERFSDLAALYRQACPERHKTALERLEPFFGPRPLSAITQRDAVAYGAQRGAPRAADIELSVLSCAFRYAVEVGLMTQNPLAGRRRIQRPEQVRHCRECMPRDGDELHNLAERLLPSSTGWQLLFAALTGCRTKELLELRTDGTSRNDPGWIEGRYLYVRRAKSGRFPYVELHPDLLECIEAHRRWKAEKFPESRWWFPSDDIFRPLNRVALAHAMYRMDGPKRTPHGLRAYCATVWRSRGEHDEQVAARLGDRTVGLIRAVYGELPEVWSGGEPLSWRRRDGTAAWQKWVPQNVVAIGAA